MALSEGRSQLASATMRRVESSSFHIYADSFPEHRLVHDPNAILPGLLGLARLRVRVGQDEQVKFLGHRIHWNQTGVGCEFFCKFAWDDLPVMPALQFAGETNALSVQARLSGCRRRGSERCASHLGSGFAK